MQTKKQIQCHGLTRQQLKEVQRANAVGEKLETIPANISKKHEIKAIESHLVHVELENKSFDSRTGTKNSKPFIQMFYPNQFDKMVKDNSFAGMSVEKIHDPRRPQVSSQDGTNTGTGNASVKNPNEAETIEDKIKAISKLKKAEIEAKYTELFGEEAPDGTIADLLGLIEDKLRFDAEEENQEN